MTDSRIKELEKKFYKDCVAINSNGFMYMDKSPMDTFQWFVDNVIKAKEEQQCPKCGKLKLFIGKLETWCESDGCDYNVVH